MSFYYEQINGFMSDIEGAKKRQEKVRGLSVEDGSP